MLRQMAFVRINVSQERIASIIKGTRISELVFLRSVLRLLVTAKFPTSPKLRFLKESHTVNTREDAILHIFNR
jgi:hypothetical protein